MEIYVIDNNTLDRIGMVDIYQSFLWESYYNDVGSFSLKCGMNFFNLLQVERFIQCSDDLNHFGIIERILKVTDNDGSEYIKVSGRMAESILDRRICFGEYTYLGKQPSEIIRDLVKKNAIDNRKIDFLELGTSAEAPEGIIDYSGKNSSLLDEIKDICSISLLGFRLKADTKEKKLIFDIYYGENRTDKDNTKIDIQEKNISSILSNWNFSNGFSGWEEKNNRRAYNYGRLEYFGPYPLTVSGGTVSKSKIADRDEEGEYIWRKSPHLEQSVNLKKNHIYYMSVTAYNPLETVLSFGVDKLLTAKQKSVYEKISSFYVPSETKKYIFFAGYGELEEVFDQFTYFRDCILIDLTETFGVGEEPSIDWCNQNIYVDSSGNLKYKIQTISFIENYNLPIIFSRDRDTLISVEYEKNIVNEKNFARILGDNNLSFDIMIGDSSQVKGSNLKEMIIDLSNISREEGGVEIPLASYEAMLKKKATATLNKMEINEVIEGEMYKLSNKNYGIDFYLGDIVSFVDDKMNYSTDLRISSAQQSWDDKGYSISIKMGNDIPNIIDTIKLVSKGAKT